MHLLKQGAQPQPNSTPSIPYGYCHCGCGQKTPMAKMTYASKGLRAGEPCRFVVGHRGGVRKGGSYPRSRAESRILVIDGVECRTIPLTKAKEAIVDVEDYGWLSQWNWHAQFDGHNWYAARAEKQEGKFRRIAMHQEICKTHNISPEVDHRDRNGLNNRKSNLRPCTHGNNMFNKRRYRNNKSGYRGVCKFPYPTPNPWMSQIQVNGRKIHLGMHATPEEAARAYDEAAKQYHGEFAHLNF